MIISEKNISKKKHLEADICIIGSGPAGISIALELKKKNKKIIVFSGGGYHETIASQDLHKGIVDSQCSHEPLEENRRRVFGGASTAWGGRCIPMDPIDFKKRSWIPYSGWPITFDELEPFYNKASNYLKSGVFDYDAPIGFNNLKPDEIIDGIDNEDIISSKLERWSTPVNFAKDYTSLLEKSEFIQVILDAHLLSFETEDGKSINSVKARIGNSNFSIRSSTFILACGGIENPRLLLASKNQFHPTGLGNKNDLVGRFYMSHFFGTYATLEPKDRESIIYDFEKDNMGVYFRRRWWITEEAQNKNEIGNAIFFLHKANDQSGHRDVLFSIVFITKFFISLISQKSIHSIKNKWIKSKDDIFIHLKTVLKEGWVELPAILKIAIKRFQKRRLPFVLPNVNSEKLGLYFQTEHMPNPNSRISLDDNSVDALGIPRVNVHIEFNEIDKKTIKTAHNIFMNRYVKASTGGYSYSESGLDKFIDEKINAFNSSAHHLGTTRMSDDPTSGVVDQNCLVHGMTNLYVAGSSIFPTGGHVNPTLTIVALAIRLAEHLNQVNE
jgi:choline dehydrogenase-like flavoprotein